MTFVIIHREGHYYVEPSPSAVPSRPIDQSLAEVLIAAQDMFYRDQTLLDTLWHDHHAA
jgi:hypothetical protein